MSRFSFPGSRKLFRAGLILVPLLIILVSLSSSDSTVPRVTGGILLITAGFFFYLGAGEFIQTLSLSRRLVLCFFSIVLLWGLTGLSRNTDGISRNSETFQRASHIRDLGERIDDVAEEGGTRVRNFMDSTLTGSTGNMINTLGEVTGAATGVLIDAVLTSTVVDSSSGPDTLTSARAGEEQPFQMMSPVRIGILAVSLLLFAALKGFIHVDRSPYTVGLFRITAVAVFTFALLEVLGFHVLMSSESKLLQGIDVQVTGLILLLLSVALGFCQRWVQYLSRRSRYVILAAGFVSTLMIKDVYYNLEGTRSAITGGLDTSLVMVSAVYVLFALVTMVLQLPTARILEKRNRELSTLQDLSHALHSSFEPGHLGQAAVRLGMQLTGAEVCWFHLSDGELYCHAGVGSWSDSLERLDRRWYRGVGQRIDATGRSFMINNYRRSTLRRLEEGDKGSSRIASMVAAPVEVRGERLGIIVAASSKQFHFLDYTRGLFDSFTRQTAQAIQSARLFGEKLQRQSLERELELARNIQRSLLPGRVDIPDGWDLSALNVPCRVMGGDYYDVIPVSDRKFAVAIADVSGKGAAAAMLMSALQASLRTLILEYLPVQTTVSRLNRTLCDRMPDATFITFFLGVIDLETGRMQYCCAGHDPPMLITESEGMNVRELSCGGLVLGVMREAAYRQEEITIPEGSRLLMYTDGVTETMSPGDEPFGRERLVGFMGNHSDQSPEEVTGNLTELLELFRDGGDQMDDITVLLLERGRG